MTVSLTAAAFSPDWASLSALRGLTGLALLVAMKLARAPPLAHLRAS